MTRSRRYRVRSRWLRLLTTALLGLGIREGGLAQIPMPDVRQMAGVPLPSGDLPDGTVSVRLVRGALSNNIPNHPVELHVEGTVRAARTDESGRALFSGVRPGARAHAVATVDGERLESQAFDVPARGGVRLILVASAQGARSAPTGPPRPGQVRLGGDSRFIIELDDEAVRVFALLDIVNSGEAPVATPGPLVFEMPSGAQGTSLLDGSSPQATASGPRVTVTGPFAPGTTPVRIAYLLPYRGSRLEIAQRLPAALDAVVVIVERAGAMRVSSPQIDRTQDVTESGRTFVVGGGPGLAANAPLVLTLEGLPHAPTWPRTVALLLAGAVVAWGVLIARRPAAEPRGAKALTARREALFDKLVRLELAHRARRLEEATYTHRRQELFRRLESIYAQLDGASSAASTAVPARRARESAAVGRSGAAG